MRSPLLSASARSPASIVIHTPDRAQACARRFAGAHEHEADCNLARNMLMVWAIGRREKPSEYTRPEPARRHYRPPTFGASMRLESVCWDEEGDISERAILPPNGDGNTERGSAKAGDLAAGYCARRAHRRLRRGARRPRVSHPGAFRVRARRWHLLRHPR